MIVLLAVDPFRHHMPTQVGLFCCAHPWACPHPKPAGSMLHFHLLSQSDHQFMLAANWLSQ